MVARLEESLGRARVAEWRAQWSVTFSLRSLAREAIRMRQGLGVASAVVYCLAGGSLKTKRMARQGIDSVPGDGR